MSDLKKYRLALGISQEIFAEFLDMTRSQLSMVEIGERLPPSESFERLQIIGKFLEANKPVQLQLPENDGNMKADFAYQAKTLDRKIVRLKSQLGKWDKNRLEILELVARFENKTLTTETAKTDLETEVYAFLLTARADANKLLPKYSPKTRAKLCMKIYILEKEAEKWREWGDG